MSKAITESWNISSWMGSIMVIKFNSLLLTGLPQTKPCDQECHPNAPWTLTSLISLFHSPGLGFVWTNIFIFFQACAEPSESPLLPFQSNASCFHTAWLPASPWMVLLCCGWTEVVEWSPGEHKHSIQYMLNNRAPSQLNKHCYFHVPEDHKGELDSINSGVLTGKT